MHALETRIVVYTNNIGLICLEAYTNTTPLSKPDNVNSILFINCSIVFGVTDKTETTPSFTHFLDTLFFPTSVALDTDLDRDLILFFLLTGLT